MADEPETQEIDPRNETWGCIHPCALLAMALEKGNIHIDDDGSFVAECSRTLSAYGWMTEDGFGIDNAMVIREYAKWSKDDESQGD